VVEVSELQGVEINQSDICIAHRLPPQRTQDKNEEPDPPGIIARFVS